MSNTARDYQGRYDYSKDMNLLCRCGHPLGVHAAENETGKRPCFNEDHYMNTGVEGAPVATGEDCDCEHFKKARKQKS